VQDCHKHGLKILYWTLANDADKLPTGFSHIDQLYNRLIGEKVDGLISEFPDYAEALVRAHLQQSQQKVHP